MSIKKHIPNLLTSSNLVCGCLGIIYCFQGDLKFAVYLIWIAMLFDFLDGFAARLLKVSSPIGKELDSLADMVTFGVLPAILILQLIEQHETGPIKYIALLIAVFSALRLAKFNVDDKQQSVFIGLPTPANALFLSSLIFVFERFPAFNQLYFLVGVAVIFSLLLVAPLELFALKFKNYAWKGNEVRFAFLLLSLTSIVFLQFLALPLIILGYILLSFVIKVTSS
ncbi:CDP-diacylglycerol--serine O-phosphatidyltransferase [Fulvivirga lutimaris]|uniref:CDP-diacylglycerol--serine O-phosphatidyltransferase n=1 Tax=Fulvivirga lutimaris TaxID=1819566 RepID=UPI0012BBD533|nr:CDP-diacylglycerol--serine O-phosphatidyltransferase [Fulvivirga lutimaris]MTI41736.1 CDP-diacylglycerol--serine O-phosphatidyltransferase [Fulvivirga lutimaris]